MSDYEPRVIAFACTYCAYTAADLAGSLRLSYPANVRIVQLTCSGRIEPIHILRAFEAGADAVFVAGCQPGDCHFLEGNLNGKRWVAHTSSLMAEIGLEPERLAYFHVAASQPREWIHAVEEMTTRARRLGPNPLGDLSHRTVQEAAVEENS